MKFFNIEMNEELKAAFTTRKKTLPGLPTSTGPTMPTNDAPIKIER